PLCRKLASYSGRPVDFSAGCGQEQTEGWRVDQASGQYHILPLPIDGNAATMSRILDPVVVRKEHAQDADIATERGACFQERAGWLRRSFPDPSKMCSKSLKEPCRLVGQCEKRGSRVCSWKLRCSPAVVSVSILISVLAVQSNPAAFYHYPNKVAVLLL